MSNLPGLEDVVDLIYEAALDPSLWVPVMERFADLIGGSSACITQLNMFAGTGSVIIARADPATVPKYFEHYARRNPLSNVKNPASYLRSWAPRILTDEDWMPKEELTRTEYYNDFLKPQSVHSCLMIRLAKEGSDIFALNINRPRRQGQFDRPDLELAAELHPHLVRAHKLGRKISAKQRLSEGMAEFIDRSSHGLFLLDGHGRVGHFNSVGRALVSESGGLTILGGRLAATRQEDARRLQHLIARAASGDGTQRTGGAMALATPSRRRPLSLIVSPMRGDRAALFPSRPAVMVCVTDLEAGASVPEQQLREVFGLTAAEGRVALFLLEGLEPRQIAHRLDVGLPTVRTHLAHTFEKTGTTGQAALTGLMTRMSSLAPA